MAFNFIIILKTVIVAFYFFIIFQSPVNEALSENKNLKFEYQIQSPLRIAKKPYNPEAANKVQMPFADRKRNELKEQHEYEAYMEFEPNESELLKESKIEFKSRILYNDKNRNPTHYLHNLQLSNNDGFSNNFQFRDYFLNLFSSNFPRVITNGIPFSLVDGIKSIQRTLFGSISNVSQMLFKTNFSPNISSKCFKSMKELQIGLSEKKLWAIRMIDSFGKIPSGILDGTLKAFGDFDMCLDVKLPGKVQGMYCLAEVKFPGDHPKRIPLQPVNLSFLFDKDFSKSIFDEALADKDVSITTSLCLPSNCSTIEVQRIVSEITKYGHQLVDVNIKHCEIRKEFKFNYGQSIIFSIMFSLFLFEILATFLDMHLRYFYKEKFSETDLSKAVQCVIAFSFYSNMIRFFKNNTSSDSVKLFLGMKVISMSWIVLGHTIIFQMNVLGRLNQVFIIWKGFIFQIAINAFHATETFFFISGFLLVYSFIKRNSSNTSFLHYSLVQLIRLIPPLLFILGCLLLSENWSSGPIWKECVTNYLVGSCKTTWWKNVLFINNIIGLKDCCLPWTWYIAAYMQFHLISYPILILMKRNPEKALYALKIIIFASVVGLVVYHISYKLPPHPLLTYIHFHDQPYYMTMLYSGTYNHVTPYYVGMFSGYIISMRKSINLNRWRQLFGWSLAGVFAFICLFSTFIWNNNDHPVSVIESAVYGGMQRFLWSLMLLWITYICLNGKAGTVYSILSWDGFVPLARLTYMVYLIHPLTQLLFFGQLKFVIFADIKILIYLFLGFLVGSYILAFVACLICEAPFTRLVSIYFSAKLKTSKKLKEHFSA